MNKIDEYLLKSSIYLISLPFRIIFVPIAIVVVVPLLVLGILFGDIFYETGMEE